VPVPRRWGGIEAGSAPSRRTSSFTRCRRSERRRLAQRATGNTRPRPVMGVRIISSRANCRAVAWNALCSSVRSSPCRTPPSSIEGRSHSVNASPRALRQLVKTSGAGNFSIDLLANPGGKHDHGLFRDQPEEDGTGPFDTAKTYLARSGQVAMRSPKSPASNFAESRQRHDRPIKNLSTGNFSQADQQAIVSAGHNLLLFVTRHNKFEDAIKRAAYNRECSRLPETNAAKTTVVPSRGLGEIAIAMPKRATNATGAGGKSGFHLQEFLKNMFDLRASCWPRIAGPRLPAGA